MMVFALITWNEKGGFQTRPYECRLHGRYFQRNRSCRLSPTPPIMKMGAERRTGNHKGCLYERFAGGYFQRNDSGGVTFKVGQ